MAVVTITPLPPAGSDLGDEQTGWGRPITDFLTLDEAAGIVGETMTRFAAAVANEQGACDTGSMETMLEEAAKRYEWASE